MKKKNNSIDHLPGTFEMLLSVSAYCALEELQLTFDIRPGLRPLL